MAMFTKPFNKGFDRSERVKNFALKYFVSKFFKGQFVKLYCGLARIKNDQQS